MASGLAGTLRSVNPDDPVDLHDLGGYDQAQVQELVKDAFGKPLPCHEPVKISFVVGAGKKGRQKYTPSLPKDLIGALTSLGFEEDRGASACMECCGNFKYQHDTDKDLKFLHVFPHVTPLRESSVSGDDEEFWDEDEDSPSEVCRRVTVWELKDLVKANVKKFSQKRVLLQTIKGFVKEFQELEARMMEQPLTAKEDERYNNCVELPEKVELITGLMEDMVSNGKLTRGEVRLVWAQLSDKIKVLEGEAEKAKADGKAKKVSKIQEAIEKMEARRDGLADIKPMVYSIKHEGQIKRLRRELNAIEKLERAGGKQLMDVSTVKKIGQKQDLQDELDDLMQDNIGWFETKASLEDMMPSAEGKKSKPKAKPSGGGGNDDGWTTKSSNKGGKGKGGSKPTQASNPFDLLSS